MVQENRTRRLKLYTCVKPLEKNAKEKPTAAFLCYPMGINTAPNGPMTAMKSGAIVFVEVPLASYHRRNVEN